MMAKIFRNFVRHLAIASKILVVSAVLLYLTLPPRYAYALRPNTSRLSAGDEGMGTSRATSNSGESVASITAAGGTQSPASDPAGPKSRKLNLRALDLSRAPTEEQLRMA